MRINGIFVKDSIDSIRERERWEERHGCAVIDRTNMVVKADSVVIGDEEFSIVELRKFKIPPRVQPASHPFKIKHYKVQAALDDVLSFFKKHPDRKPRV